MRNEHILVLMGGSSSEREVSLRSGKAVADALRKRFARVSEWDLSDTNADEIARLKPDAVFIALHGKGGEDGSIQQELEKMGFPYTGPGVEASRLCIDKILTKRRLLANQIPTPDFFEINESDDIQKSTEKAYKTLGLPLVLKASCQGSSIGTVIVRRAEELEKTVRELFLLGDTVLAEQFLSGMEVTVPIFGNDEVTVLPVIEIVSEGEFYDYQSKYTPGQSHHIIPARLDENSLETIRTLAADAYRVCGCRGLSRVDLILDDRKNPYVIEINTIPGMTETSLFPEAAEKAGICFPRLVEILIDLALEGHK